MAPLLLAVLSCHDIAWKRHGSVVDFALTGHMASWAGLKVAIWCFISAVWLSDRHFFERARGLRHRTEQTAQRRNHDMSLLVSRYVFRETVRGDRSRPGLSVGASTQLAIARDRSSTIVPAKCFSWSMELHCGEHRI